ncbi:MAG: ATP-binding cassette domain-containing protein [Oscillospiraceae bacterium]|nr:ATP-binding cassette domain-containing protein [Oscillospiraceae bacterium]MDY4191033.1 ATP-binding cassette domain-containing protein [Oscillospiraceae bacterium]
MLKLSHISKTFNPGTVNEKSALSDISLSLETGEFVTIIGSNGAGKSTLFGAISGSLPTDSGRILLDGTDITRLPEYKRSKYIGRMFQDPLKGTAPHMTIEENLALAYLRASGRTSPFSMVSRAERERFREQLSQLGLGLESRMKQPVGLLSGGQRQALTLLMATVVTPKLLLLDEHTAALDPATAEKVLALTGDIVQKEHITCMMITHNIESALTLGNRTIIMSGGKIVFSLSGKEREGMTLESLMELFRQYTSKNLDSDKMLLREM